jgi:hypothetical protein
MLGGSLFFVGRSLSEDREREVKGSSSEELGHPFRVFRAFLEESL